MRLTQEQTKADEVFAASGITPSGGGDAQAGDDNGAGHPRTRNVFFAITFFCGNFVLQKSWNADQLRLVIAPLALF